MQARLLKAGFISSLFLVFTAGPATAGFHASAELLGANQVPPRVTPATGFATVVYDDVAGTLSVELSYADLLGIPAAAHIHVGPPTANGPVLIEFDGFPNTTTGMYANVFTDADVTGALGITTIAALAAQIGAGNAYINIHTTVYPGGEIRGQLVPAPAAAVLALTGGAGLLVGRLRRRVIGA